MTRAALVAALALSPALALAQAQTGTIAGEVADQDGLPIADARVVARSPTQIGGDRVVSTDANGRFRFLNLIPGVFEVRISKTGLSPIVKEGLRVQAGRTIDLFEIMTVPTAEREIVVTAPPPVVDVEQTEVGETISDDELEDLPIQGRGYQSAAATVPGVQGASNPNIRGGASYNNTYTVDGITITDPVTHTFGTNFNYDAISNIEVLTAGYGPEYSTTTGGVINVVTHSGSNDLHFDLSTYYSDDAMSVDRADVRGQEFRDLDANLNASGPIIRDRLWWFASLQVEDRVASLPVDPTGRLPDHPSRRFLGYRYLGKTTLQIANPTQLILSVQGSPASIDNTRQTPTVLPEAETHQDQRTLYLSAEVRQNFGPNVLWRTQLVYGNIVLHVFPQSRDFETPGYAPDAATGIESVNARTLVTDRRYNLALNSDVTQHLGRGLGTHALRYGVKYEHGWNPSFERVPGDLTYTTRNGEPYSRTFSCLEYDEESETCTEQGGLEVETEGDRFLLFLQDGWSPRFYDRLTVAPGVGIQYGRMENYAGETVAQFTTATPHLNLVWRPRGDNRTAVRAGYNQYVDVGFLALAGFAGRQLETRTCFYDEDSPLPEEERYTLNCTSAGGLDGATVGLPNGVREFDDDGNPVTTNPDPLTVPRVHEIHAGVEHEIVRSFAAGTDVVYRDYSHQFEDIETNAVWNGAGTQPVSFRNGEERFVFDLETPASARRTSFSWTVFGRRAGPRWSLLSSYTYQRDLGTVNETLFASYYLDNAVQERFFYGPLTDDRIHSVKVTGSYEIIEPLTASTLITYQTGAPYSRLFFNPMFGFQDRRAPRGQNPNDVTDPTDDTDLRLPATLDIGVKVAFTFLPYIKQDLEIIFEVFNLFNLDAATAVEQRELAPGAPTQFGDVLARQPPLRARVGLRYQY